jgi:N-acetylglucosamine-6-phosphate deacetylase
MENNTQLYHTKKLFTGHQWLENQTVVVSAGKIIDLVATKKLPENTADIHQIIAPAFIDLQIYGANDKLLSVYPETDSLHRLYQYCTEGGASHFQPTVATNSTQVFYQCIDAVREYWKARGKGCIGLHIEGPWINAIKKGAHTESFIHSPDLEDVKELLEYGKGVVTMITLAPEVCSHEVVTLIQSYGVIVSAGHSNANYETATKAFDLGIDTATHLYNAMSPLQHREPGMVGAIFNHPTVMSSIVPDGFHVDFSALIIAKKIMKERLFVITDAVTETILGDSPHHLVGDKYELNGILSGSALTMAKALRNLVNHANIEFDEALRMLSLYPAQVIKKENRMGKIEKGVDANLVFLNEALEVTGLVGG